MNPEINIKSIFIYIYEHNIYTQLITLHSLFLARGSSTILKHKLKYELETFVILILSESANPYILHSPKDLIFFYISKGR